MAFDTFGYKLSVNCPSDMPRKPATPKPGVRGINLRIQRNKGRDCLYLDIVQNGKRRKEFLRLYLTGNRDADRETMLLAEQIKAKRIRELSLKRAGIEELQLRPEEDFLSFFDEAAADRGKTWQNVRHHLSNYVKGRPRFGDIDEKWIDGFRRHLEKQDLKTNSVATYLDVLKTAFNMAIKQKIVGVNPFVYAKPIKRVRTSREYLTLEELRALHATPAQYDMVKRSFLFACLTGLRISDLRQLTWRNVQGAELKVTQKKTGDHVSVPISDQARSLLPERGNARPGDRIFDFPSRDDVYNRRLQWWVADAGIEKHITSHVARHTFATLLVSQGNDLYAVQHLLGHRDIKVTQIYAKLVDQRKHDAIQSLPSLNVDESEP
jgi:site-specific recombinase XerD